MWKRSAVTRAHIVNAAALFVKKAAGDLCEAILAFLVRWSKVIVDQLRFLNVQMIGQSPDVAGRKLGRHNSAAIRACAAVYLSGDHVEVAPDKTVERSYRQITALNIRPEAPVLVFLLPGQGSDPLNICLYIHELSC
jgi:hypothetical protein